MKNLSPRLEQKPAETAKAWKQEVLMSPLLSVLTLTFKSLKGWISIPNGNLDFCRSEFVSGIFVKVHLKILK